MVTKRPFLRRDYSGLDEYDLGIIAQLENDGRRGLSEMADALGIHRNTVRVKLNRLIERRVIRPAVYVDPRTLGFRAPAIIGIKVVPSEIEKVARRVAALPNIHHVHVCLGRYDIVLAGSLFRDEDELLSFVTNELSKTPGVVDVETMITVGLSKVTFAVVEGQQLERQGNPREREAIGASLDEDDYAIIRELQRDARQSAFALAAALGMNRNTVAARLRHLLDQEIVRAVVIADPAMMGYSVMAIFGLSVLPGQIDAVLAHLRSLRNLQTSVLCIGRYNIVVWCLCRNLEELYDTVTVNLAGITGLREVETMLILRTKKATLDYLQPSQSVRN
jgi:Lrp/AsnC family transcriptional regulator for asnA, asnC and gidA